MPTLLRAQNLSRRFGRRLAVSHVDLNLARGEVLGLLGPNGAGKTTCLRLLAGSLVPSDGRVEIDGIDLTRDPLRARARLGYLPERPPLYAELRVDEYLTYCARIRRIPSARIAEYVALARERCGLDGKGRVPIQRLSKGYRQRLGIAQAILHQPAIVILDEPTDGLDPLQMRELRRLIRELARESGVILSSHLLPEVQAVCDRAAIMHRGSVQFVTRIAHDDDNRRWRLRIGGLPEGGLSSVCELVDDCTQVDRETWLVELAPKVSSADLARVLIEAGYDLLELSPRPSDLERVFFDLIGAEEIS